MPNTLIPGYFATVTLNATDVTAIASGYNLKLSRTVMTKNLAGTKWAASLGGQQNYSFSVKGSLSAEEMAGLLAAADAGRIAFSFQVGEASGDTDAGVFSGTAEVSGFSIDGEADGEFDWSADLQSSGAVTHTPAES